MTSPASTYSLPPNRLRAPSDVVVANRVFGANCGPSSFAAILSLQVCDIMQFFSHFETRCFTTMRDMRAAAEACGIQFAVTNDFPDFGIALIQLNGPWMNYPNSARWSGQYTHWVGVCGGDIYDINSGEWVPMEEWKDRVIPQLIRATPKATSWSLKCSLRVLAQPFQAEQAVPGLVFD